MNKLYYAITVLTILMTTIITSVFNLGSSNTAFQVISSYASTGIDESVINSEKKDKDLKSKVVMIDLNEVITKNDMTYESPVSTGAGFMLPNGYILTNNHVAPPSHNGNTKLTYQIRFYSNEFYSTYIEATLVASNLKNDLAILKVDVDQIPDEYKDKYFSKFDTEYASNKSIKIIGHPTKSIEVDTNDVRMTSSRSDIVIAPTTMTYAWEEDNGTIDTDSINVTRNAFDDQPRTTYNVMQLKVSAFPGNSGGPVVNSNGDIIGVVSAGVRNTDKTFAVRSETILQFIKDNDLEESIFN